MNNELYHWGIKGQKWGVRRFQKKDGSLTAAGKKRYDDNGIASNKKDPRMEEYKRRRGINPNYGSGSHDTLRDAAKNGENIANGIHNAIKMIKKKTGDLPQDTKVASAASEKNNRRREIAIGVGAAAGTALAAYGVYKVSTAIKNNAFKHSMNRGMKAAKILAEKGKFNIALDQIDSIYSHHGDSLGQVLKRTISNNEVNGRVDWRNVGKILLK